MYVGNFKIPAQHVETANTAIKSLGMNFNPANTYTKVCVSDYKKYLAMAVKAGGVFDKDKNTYTFIGGATWEGETTKIPGGG